MSSALRGGVRDRARRVSGYAGASRGYATSVSGVAVAA